MRVSPHKLYEMANGNSQKYKELLIEHKYLIPRKILGTKEEVAKFRQDLEEGTKEKFKELDRNKRQSYIKAKEIILD